MLNATITLHNNVVGYDLHIGIYGRKESHNSYLHFNLSWTFWPRIIIALVCGTYVFPIFARCIDVAIYWNSRYFDMIEEIIPYSIKSAADGFFFAISQQQLYVVYILWIWFLLFFNYRLSYHFYNKPFNVFNFDLKCIVIIVTPKTYTNWFVGCQVQVCIWTKSVANKIQNWSIFFASLQLWSTLIMKRTLFRIAMKSILFVIYIALENYRAYITKHK